MGALKCPLYVWQLTCSKQIPNLTESVGSSLSRIHSCGVCTHPPRTWLLPLWSWIMQLLIFVCVLTVRKVNCHFVKDRFVKNHFPLKPYYFILFLQTTKVINSKFDFATPLSRVFSVLAISHNDLTSVNVPRGSQNKVQMFSDNLLGCTAVWPPELRCVSLHPSCHIHCFTLIDYYIILGFYSDDCHYGNRFTVPPLLQPMFI